MSRIRVLVVDDAVVVRRLVTRTLTEDAELEVIGVAANGRIALAKVEQHSPDLLTLDVEMPVMDGLETLRRLRETHPDLPVIMFSTLTARGAVATLDALTLGANDYVTKLANVGGVTAAIEALKTELIPKIKALVGARRQKTLTGPSAPARRLAIRPREERPAAPVKAIAIGISTGGPNALAELLPALPGDLPVPVVIVQHMPPLFTRFLAERLNSKSALTVREAEEGAVLEPGCAWIAQGGHHLVLTRAGMEVRLGLSEDPPENSCRPAVDVLFRSAAQAYGAGALGVVMTGMGHDGRAGAEHIREAGGRIVIQDEKSAVVWGMPGAVAEAQLADACFPLDRLAAQITRRVTPPIPALSAGTSLVASD